MHLPQQTLPDVTLLSLRWWYAADSSYALLPTSSWLRSVSSATLSTSPVGIIISWPYWCSAIASSTRSSTPPSTVSFSRASDVCCRRWRCINSSLEFQQSPEVGLLQCVSKKFSFLWLLVQMLTDFNNIWQYCSGENLQTTDLFRCYNIQFVYDYYRIEKEEIFCILSMLPLRLAVVPLSGSLFNLKFVQFQLPTLPNLY